MWNSGRTGWRSRDEVETHLLHDKKLLNALAGLVVDV